MTFYKKLTVILGLCVLSSFADAAAGAEPESRFMHITVDGAVAVSDEKQAELKAIAQRGLNGDDGIHVIQGLDLHVDRLVDTDERPIRGGYRDIIEIDKILVFYNNKVTVDAAGLRVGVETPAYLGGFVGSVKARMVLVIGCINGGAWQCDVGLTHMSSPDRRIATFFGNVDGELYMAHCPQADENEGYIGHPELPEAPAE